MSTFPIRALHQIEMTSHCNLRCKYCTSPTLKRPKLHMAEDVYRRALDWARLFHVTNGQRELNLAGIGESTMHPEFVRYLFLAREVVGHGVNLVLATNGLLMSDDLARAIAPMRPTVFVSLHRPEKAGPAIEALKRAGIYAGASNDPSLAATNWAGQVKWHVSAPKGRQCPWVRGAKVMVMADGRITRCSLDSSGEGVICTVFDDLQKYATTAYGLCASCDQDVGVPIPQPQTAEVA